jgi:hypothetical protein
VFQRIVPTAKGINDARPGKPAMYRLVGLCCSASDANGYGHIPHTRICWRWRYSNFDKYSSYSNYYGAVPRTNSSIQRHQRTLSVCLTFPRPFRQTEPIFDMRYSAALLALASVTSALKIPSFAPPSFPVSNIDNDGVSHSGSKAPVSG